MDRLRKSFLMPHPPIMVPEIGNGEERKIRNTVSSAERVGAEIASLQPDCIVMVVPPHGPAFSDAMSVAADKSLKGNFGRFGAPGVELEFDSDSLIAGLILKKCAERDVPAVGVDSGIAGRYGIPSELDHGSLVPLYFIKKKYSAFRLVLITYGILPAEQLYDFGAVVRSSIEESGESAVFIASGDLSHRLTVDSPNGYNPRGREFDEFIVEHLKGPDSDSIMRADAAFVEEAGQCGYRSILTLLGTLDGEDASGNVMSYEGPFGVGYCVAGFDIAGADDRNKKVAYYYNMSAERIKSIREREDPYVSLARKSLEYYIKNHRRMDIPTGLPDEMIKERAGVFVSIKREGELRGCIGTISATTENIAREIMQNAVSAGTGDPRFYPVGQSELNSLVYSVDVLGASETIDSADELDTARYGVIVRSGGRSGLLLPDLEGVDTAEQQISIALGKAGIGPREDYTMERFTVVRHR